MIKKIYIENFKSIEKQTIQFDEFSMLIGENGSGKTNLIHAISFIKKVALGPNIVEAYQAFAALPSELLNKRSNKNLFKINITLINGDETEYHISYDFLLALTNPIKNLTISYEKFEVVSKGISSIIFERKGDNIISAPSGASNLKIEGTVSAMSVVDHPSVQKAKDIFSEIYISEADISTSGSKHYPLEQRVINVIVALRKKNEEDYKKFEVIIKKLIPALSSLTDVSDTLSRVVNDANTNEYQILFTEKNMEGSLSMKAGSHGDLRTYYILALVFYAGEHSTIIIEELENGIHTKRAKDLIDFLEKIAYQQNKQLIVSSHNPRLIGKIAYEKLISVERSPEMGTIYKKFKDAADIAALEEYLEQGGEVTELL